MTDKMTKTELYEFVKVANPPAGRGATMWDYRKRKSPPKSKRLQAFIGLIQSPKGGVFTFDDPDGQCILTVSPDE